MIVIREFIRAGGANTNDSQLMSLVRGRMLGSPHHEQRGWLQEVELMLDAYATKPQMEAAARLRTVLKQLSTEVAGAA